MTITKLGDVSSSSSDASSCLDPATTTFSPFMKLPPEIRHQIYLAAIPSPGVNFFNIHSFPNDHHGANRSTSPPNLHLDLRRLSIDDDDDDVAKYDPSVWQIRHALRQTCREARIICAIPEGKVVCLTLSIPKRGLFTHAGDGLQRSMTPLLLPDRHFEPAVYRQVQIHADDVVALSVENCSFNIVFEESTMFHVGRDDEEDEINLGWAYDPQFKDGRPLGIPSTRFCLNLARDEWATMRALEEIAGALLEASTGAGQDVPGNDANRGLVMLDNEAEHMDDVTRKYRKKQLKQYWDRWEDLYISIPWDYEDLPMNLQLMKISPEKTSLRTRYLRSAILRSPKRPL
ncbi:hypothetical protein PFICI_14605 [Pestalotiopsis fici W106-1]|uniref:2EXR domain-containing protein n=1 Tax=Pestalotiopsis fici (strain W106-1 / CGMCC3.15140) TaxID=1229662 RepID=W3WIP5_PESFW|nr:uncharacterized protein PFICI_14605 [Pestalotiopsis fici W106-1]ETS73659.1 hypothetical protein PFICI_14605 [Pestalotiopsis fici W106-1]